MSIRTSRVLVSVVVALVAAACGGSAAPETGPQPASPRPQPMTPEKASTVTSDQLEQTPPTESIEDILRGRVAGVVVSRAPDGGIAVRIRGATSLHGNNEPLYVLDGMPIAAGPGGSLTGINPRDIESIRVLKDPTDTAMYGARGANGVIVIKTKKPKQE